MLFSNKKCSTTLNIKIEGIKITQVNKAKLFGVMIEDKIIWKDHILYISNKISNGIDTETEMSSFWWNFHHWLHWKLSKWQLPVQPVMKISSKWRHFRFSGCNHQSSTVREKHYHLCIVLYYTTTLHIVAKYGEQHIEILSKLQKSYRDHLLKNRLHHCITQKIWCGNMIYRLSQIYIILMLIFHTYGLASQCQFSHFFNHPFFHLCPTVRILPMKEITGHINPLGFSPICHIYVLHI